MRSLHKLWPALLGVMIVGGTFANRASCQFEEMVKYIPGHANMLVLVDAEKVFSSEIAKAENWAAQRGQRFDSGLTFIPAKATQVAIGSQLDLEYMRPMWDAAIVAFDTAPSLEDIGRRFGGIGDTIAKTPVLLVDDDSYVAKLSDNLVGAFGPANRQLASSWIQRKNANLSPYLQEALKYELAGAAIIMAIDATDVLTPAFVEEKITNSENDAVKKTKLSPEEIADLVSSLKGVMLGVTFGKQPYARLKVDFGQDVTALAGIADPLVRASLANHGAVLEEMDQWKVEVKGKQIFFSGYLGDSGLARIASMINLPTNALHAPAKAAAAGTDTATQSPSDPNKLVIETTQQYYKSIERIMKDLKGHKGEARTIGQIGMWFGNYANKVDRLPILNVDEEMLQFGRYIGQQLRNCSMSIKGAGIQKGVADANADASAQPFGGVIGQSVSDYYANGSYGRPVGAAAAYGWARGQGAGNTAYWAGRSEMRQAMEARARFPPSTRPRSARPCSRSWNRCVRRRQKSGPT